jgi:UDP-glucuronate 4-epimerase
VSIDKAPPNGSSHERVLVTGAAGFIGSHVCQRLLSEGAAVFGLDNFDPFYDPALKRRNLEAVGQSPEFDFYQGDIRDPAALEKAFAFGPTAVIHLAALAGVRPSIERPADYVDVNLMGTTGLLEACVKHGVERMVFASSSSVYGNRARGPFRETDPVDDPVSPYAATKKAGELLCYTYCHLHGLSISCLRYFTVYGPRQRPEMAIHRFVRRLHEGRPLPLFGDGSSSRDYTYVDDAVAGTLAALRHLDGFAVYNIGDSQPVTLDGLVDAIERATGLSAERRYLPAQPGDVRTTFAEISRAQERLGYRPQVDLATGLGRFVAWYRRRFGDGQAEGEGSQP